MTLIQTTLLGFGIIVLAAGAVSTPYIIGSCAVALLSEREYGHGARWFLGSAAIFLVAASYYVGDLLI